MPIDQSGVAQARTWAAQLANRRLGALWTSDEMTGQQTARCIHDTIGVPVRTLPGIEEVSLGLWEGLKSETLKSRFPKVYKRWLDDPTAICPPNGESLESASQRIEATLVRAIRKARQEHVGVVLGPMAASVLCCVLEDDDLASVRAYVPEVPCDYEIHVHDGKLAGQNSAIFSSR